MSANESISDAENDLEVIVEGDQQDEVEGQAENTNEAGDENQENDDDKSKKVKVKRVVKNPQPKLNEQTLKGPRGLPAIESYFERVKFMGRGYEEQDLNVLLKTYEYWCHRLFPKFPFDNCIERLEKLGTKRATRTQITKIRMGLNFDEPEILRMSDEEVNDTGGFVDTYNDQFDELTSTPAIEIEPQITEEQLERMRANMERARRLREEKLRIYGDNSQNSLGIVHSQNTQNVGSPQLEAVNNSGSRNSQNSLKIIHSQNTQDVEPPQLVAINNSEKSRNSQNSLDVIHSQNTQNVENPQLETVTSNSDCQAQENSEMEYEINKTNQLEDNEDDIENILDFINADDHPATEDTTVTKDSNIGNSINELTEINKEQSTNSLTEMECGESSP